MGGKTVERVFHKPAPVVFEASKRAIASLGYTVIHMDPTGLSISFNTGRSMSTWAGQDLTATIFNDGASSKVVVGGSLAARGNPLGGGGQIGAWGEKKRLSNRFLDEIPSHLGAAASADSLERDCPYCAERIKAAALKCKHCGSDVGASAGSSNPQIRALEEDLQAGRITAAEYSDRKLQILKGM